jgi:hypothetical protein
VTRGTTFSVVSYVLMYVAGIPSHTMRSRPSIALETILLSPVGSLTAPNPRLPAQRVPDSLLPFTCFVASVPLRVAMARTKLLFPEPPSGIDERHQEPN